MVQICPECETYNDDVDKKCSYCGFNFKKARMKYERETKNSPRHTGKCVFCHQKTEFKKRDGRIGGNLGAPLHVVEIFACKKCGYIHFFELNKGPEAMG